MVATKEKGVNWSNIAVGEFGIQKVWVLTTDDVPNA